MRTHRIDPNGLDLVAYFGMPNINYIVIGKGTNREWEGEGELLMFRVPVDDESHLQYFLNWSDAGYDLIVPNKVGLVNVKRNETVQAVLAGDLTMDEVIAGSDGLDLFSIQDDIAMVSQGRMYERRGEHLGSSDVAIALMRRLWDRDLRALREGRSRKDWHRTPEMTPRVAAIPKALR